MSEAESTRTAENGSQRADLIRHKKSGRPGISIVDSGHLLASFSSDEVVEIQVVFNHGNAVWHYDDETSVWEVHGIQSEADL